MEKKKKMKTKTEEGKTIGEQCRTSHDDIVQLSGDDDNNKWWSGSMTNGGVSNDWRQSVKKEK